MDENKIRDKPTRVSRQAAKIRKRFLFRFEIRKNNYLRIRLFSLLPHQDQRENLRVFRICCWSERKLLQLHDRTNYLEHKVLLIFFPEPVLKSHKV
ncbi:MAG: hypothetical protein US75_C0011G0007 [Candidatus Woesebacteria bacterium GW2011_GWC1_38_13]|uniref:Uncharacterized protein n=1 Tax=Candidatus Woesebacteria bacterium GW2011_GWC1_38_13 TaxID=1618583 RepID=A0A0G0IY37_9BACT|nr:MAG: hypothetical protein US75_C0011G0007 [Candidatus Woesebacteria bacterium GW2011_GWC1_38_13]